MNLYEEIKDRYFKSNKYMLCVTYEDIGTLIHIIEVLNKRLKDDSNTSIPKDKIKSKLDEISIEFSRILAKNNQSLETININSQRYDAMRIVLEELLEER